MHGPFCEATDLNHVKGRPGYWGAIYEAGGNPWFGLDNLEDGDLGERLDENRGGSLPCRAREAIRFWSGRWDRGGGVLCGKRGPPRCSRAVMARGDMAGMWDGLHGASDRAGVAPGRRGADAASFVTDPAGL